MTDRIDSSPGLMTRIKSRLASALGFGSYLRASVTETDNISSLQGKSRDFNPKIAVDNFFSLVYAAAQMNANAVARTPLRLYGRKRKGKTANFPMNRVPSRRKQYLAGRLVDVPSSRVACKVINFGEDFQEITDHPALDVLRGVNKWMNAYDMSVLRILYLELTGNAYCYVRMGAVRGRSFPIELWPMPSQWMKVIPSREVDSPIISGYAYGRNDGELQYYDPEEVIRWNYPNPRNLYYGLGKVEAAWREICLRNSKSAHDQAVFDNGARPDYAVLLKGAREGEATRFQKELEQRLRGVRNRGKFAVVNAEQCDIKPLTFTAVELGDQDAVKEVICNVFGVPIAKFVTNKNVAGGQAGVSDVGYLRDTVLPICRMDEETLNADFLPRFDGAADDLVFAYDNPVPEDRAAQLLDDTMRLQQGVITRDEWRTENGYDAVGGMAAELLVPAGLTPIEQAGAARQEVDETEPDEDEEDDDLAAAVDTVKSIGASLEKVVAESQEKTARAVAKAVEDLTPKPVEPVAKAVGDLLPQRDDPADVRQRKERNLLLLLLAFWSSQKEEILSGIDPANHQPITNKPEWDAKLSAALLGGMIPVGIAAAHESAQNAGLTVPAREVNAAVQDSLQDVADKFAPLINQTTIDRINDAMSGVVNGADNAPELLRSAIDNVFDFSEKQRGPAITDDAEYIAGQVGKITPAEVANKTLPPEEQITATWKTEEDGRVCNQCDPLNNRTVVAGQPFASSGDVFGGKPTDFFHSDVYHPVVDTHPFCRCHLEFDNKPVNYPPQEEAKPETPPVKEQGDEG